MTLYTIWNNTDYRDHPFTTTILSEAERLWTKVRPAPDRRVRGNKYEAAFTATCGRCGAEQDAEDDIRTCYTCHNDL